MQQALSAFLRDRLSPMPSLNAPVELEMPALAIADRNGLYGVARLHTAALRNKVRAHIGAEISVSSFGTQGHSS